MSSEIEEIVTDSIEEMAVDDVIEEQKERGEAKRQKRRNPRLRWELWVALSSSLLAVLSAISALLATFAADEASIALASESDYAAYAEGVNSSHTVLKAKMDILASMGKPASPEDLAEMQRLDQFQHQIHKRMEETEAEGKQSFKIHDRLAIAVTLFQVTMLLGGLSVMVERAAIWRFGLLFSVAGIIFLASGLAGYLA